MAARKSEQAPEPEQPVPSEAGRAADDVRQRMREALEAKQAKQRKTHGEDHLGGRRVGPSTNDKQRRQFRRKSGG